MEGEYIMVENNLNNFIESGQASIDELFDKTEKYRNSSEYMRLMSFISNFRRYSPYNCMLMHIQDPLITYVATISDWKHKFDRYPKVDVRPLLILQPFGPVMFLYDIKDTEGKATPEEIEKPFKINGNLSGNAYNNLKANCIHHGISVEYKKMSANNAGYAQRINTNQVQDYKDNKLYFKTNYKIVINSELTLNEKYSTLAHEIGHILCGHLGMDPIGWWNDRSSNNDEIVEIEA